MPEVRSGPLEFKFNPDAALTVFNRAQVNNVASLLFEGFLMRENQFLSLIHLRGQLDQSPMGVDYLRGRRFLEWLAIAIAVHKDADADMYSLASPDAALGPGGRGS